MNGVMQFFRKVKKQRQFVWENTSFNERPRNGKKFNKTTNDLP